MKMRIWIQGGATPAYTDGLKEVADVSFSKEESDSAGAHGVVISSHIAANAEFMDCAGSQLLVIARPGAGYDNVDIKAATERGILAVNTPEAPTQSTAEHGVALLLALSKRVVPGHLRLRGEEMPGGLGTEIRGLTLGIVGFGRIGRRMAEICVKGLGMKVIVFDPYANASAAESLGVQLVPDLVALLRNSDFVSLNTVLTAETKGMMGKEQFRLMKKGSCLINVGRGALVDEDALVESLKESHLGGAALDVFHPSLPTPDHPLLKMPNVVVTPHVSAATTQCYAAMRDGVMKQLIQISKGERPSWLINPDAWPGRVARFIGREESYAGVK
jgi:D-3-phosphoglycerate dehydrogenase